MSIIKHVTLQKIVAHDFRYDPRTYVFCVTLARKANFFPIKHQVISLYNEHCLCSLKGRNRICKKIRAFWDVTPCRLVNSYGSFDPDDGRQVAPQKHK